MVKNTLQPNKYKKYLSKKNKKLFLLVSASVVGTVPIVSSFGVVNSSIKMNLFKGAYSLGNRNFDSYKSLMNYVDANSKSVDIEGNNSKWTAKINGVVKTYNDPNQLRNELFNQNVKVRQIKTDVDLSKYAGPNGVIGLTNSEVWNHISYDVNSRNVIYQGANDHSYNNSEEAYKSYFQTKEGFTFNGINFSSKSDLKTYLEREYFPNRNNVNNTVIITSPSGNSIPIDLSKANAFDTLSNFINDNAEIRLSYKTNNDKVINLTRDNIQSHMDEVNLKDLNYQHVQSNQGVSRYIIDNKDDADLIGPYFYDGVLDISSFKDKKMWKKVTGVAKSVYVESKVDSIIGSFFSSIINDDNNLNKIQAEDGNSQILLFRTLLSTSDGKSYDEWFINELKSLSPQLANEVINANVSMMSGKKYNSFYKIPVLYSFLLQRAISWGLGQDVINLIIDYFTNVCNFIQDVLEFISLYSPDLLLSKNKSNKFNMVDFFQIGNPEYDINTSTEYFLNQIKTNYPNLVAMSYAYTQAENNISLAAGLIPFESVNFDFLFETDLIEVSELLSINNQLKNVYDTFSQLNSNDMVKLYVQNNHDTNIKSIPSKQPDQSKWIDELKLIKTPRTNQTVDFLLTAIGAKNNQYFTMAESVLNSEIKIFLESSALLTGGYLDKLSDNGKNKNLLSLFINLVKGNEGKISSYRVYLAFMLDKKSNTNVFNNGNTDITNDEFARRLSYLISMTLGTGLLVGSSMSKLYSNKDPGIVHVWYNPIFGWMEQNTPPSNGGTISPDKVSINVGDSLDSGSLHLVDDVSSIRSGFMNPNIDLDNISNFDFQIEQLSNAIFNHSHDKIDSIINDGLTLSPVDRTNNSSVLISPIDNAEIINASNFDDKSDLVSLHSNIYDKPESLVDFNKTKKAWWSGYTNKFQKLKEAAATVLNYAVEIFASALTVLEFAFFFIDLFKETYTQNFYQYTTADGTSFYWNGGLSVSKYFGFVNEELINIDKMELINPVAITMPQIEEYYYYDGIKYYDASELKRKILLNYINGIDTPKNSKFSKYYALLSNEDNTSKTIDDLINKVIASLKITKKADGSFDFSNLDKNSPYIQTLSASYDNGYIISSSDNNVTLIKNITDNIRPANFVALPTLGSNNVAIGQAGTIDKLPGKWWNGSSVVDNGNVDNILVDNSANNLKQGLQNQMIWNQDNFEITDSKAANQKSLENLYNLFKTKFNIASKEVLDIGQVTNKYSSLPSQTIIQLVYEIKDSKTNRIYTFNDISSASSYLFNSVGLTKHTDKQGTKIFFNGMCFNNKKELYKWVHDNMVSIN